MIRRTLRRAVAVNYHPERSEGSAFCGLSLERVYYVYTLASRSRILYVGVTNDLLRRISQHRTGTIPGFTTRYRIHRLPHYEAFCEVRVPTAREKEIKGWRPEKKTDLIEERNPSWEDLAEKFLGRPTPRKIRSLASRGMTATASDGRS